MSDTPNEPGPRPAEPRPNEPRPADPRPGDPSLGDDPRGGVGDLVRKALLAGVGALFMTEEGIRKTVSELKLPKEAFAALHAQAERTRGEASKVLRKEIRRFLNSEAFKQQLASLVSGLTLEVKAEIRLKPAGTAPDVAAKLRVKQTPPPEEPT